MPAEKSLLSVIELGGYPDFGPLYRRYGYVTHVVFSMRKALGKLKNLKPQVVVAEFNYQSDFRDRTSSLESLIAVAQQNPQMRLIVFFEREYAHQFDKLCARYRFFATYPYPVKPSHMEAALDRLSQGVDNEVN